VPKSTRLSFEFLEDRTTPTRVPDPGVGICGVGILPEPELNNTLVVTSDAPPVQLPPSGQQVDVSVTNSGQGVVPFGSRVTFTVVVSNSGPDAATGTIFTDMLPGTLFDATWTSSTSTGVTGSAGSGHVASFGGGSIREMLDLPANSSITYVVQGTFGAGGGNTLSNWATTKVSPSLTDTNPANNFATANDTTIGTPTTRVPVDIKVTTTPYQQYVNVGGQATFTFVITNNGTTDVNDVMVGTAAPFLLPDRLASWTSVESGGASGSGGSGSSNIWEPVNLPAGASITYTVTVPIPDTMQDVFPGEVLPETPVAAHVTVTLPPGFIDVDTNSPYVRGEADITVLTPGVPTPPPPVNAPVAPVSPPPLGAPRAFTVGTGSGVESQAVVYNTDGSVRFNLNPFPGYRGGVRVATGDVNGDGISDIVVGAILQSDNGHVVVFDGATGQMIASFQTFEQYEGGVNVAVGNVLGDGFGDIIVGSDSDAPHVEVFSLATGAPGLRSSFLAYDGFSGGVSVAAGDLDGDGIEEIITGVASGGPAHVKVFDLHTLRPALLLVSSFIYQPGYTGGINVAAGNLGGTSDVLLIAPTSAGAGDQVQVYDLAGARSGTPVATLTPQISGSDTGVRVAIGAVPGGNQNSILIAPGPGHNATVLAYDLSGNMINSRAPFPGYEGGVFVG
jgi:uncharacterized repeat protein (TIGR01451 family)